MSQTRLRRRRAPGAGRRGCRSGPSAARQRGARGAVDGRRSKGAGRGSQAVAVTWESFARGARAVPPLSPARPRCVRDRWVARTRARRRGRGHRRRVNGCRGSASACGPRLQTARELHNAVATAEVRIRARHRYLQKTRVQRHSLRGPTRHSARGIRSRYAITRRSGAARVRRQPQSIWEGFFLEMKNRGRKFPRNFRNFHFQRKFPLPGEPAEATPHETLAVAEPATGSNTI